MKIRESVAFVTGANRGFGYALTRALLEAGATKVYAASREGMGLDHGRESGRVIPVKLDVTKPEEVAAAARQCGDVNLLINNAGIAGKTDLLAPEALADVRRMVETNTLGMLSMTQAFAPVLARNDGGVVVDILSIVSWLSLPNVGAYAASKAASWSITNGLRHALRSQGTRVVAVHVSFMDTEMTKAVTAPKTSPDAVAKQVVEAVESGEDEVLADADSRQVKGGLSNTPGSYFDVGGGA